MLAFSHNAQNTFFFFLINKIVLCYILIIGLLLSDLNDPEHPSDKFFFQLFNFTETIMY